MWDYHSSTITFTHIIKMIANDCYQNKIEKNMMFTTDIWATRKKHQEDKKVGTLQLISRMIDDSAREVLSTLIIEESNWYDEPNYDIDSMLLCKKEHLHSDAHPSI